MDYTEFNYHEFVCFAELGVAVRERIETLVFYPKP